MVFELWLKNDLAIMLSQVPIQAFAVHLFFNYCSEMMLHHCELDIVCLPFVHRLWWIKYFAATRFCLIIIFDLFEKTEMRFYWILRRFIGISKVKNRKFLAHLTFSHEKWNIFYVYGTTRDFSCGLTSKRKAYWTIFNRITVTVSSGFLWRLFCCFTFALVFAIFSALRYLKL